MKTEELKAKGFTDEQIAFIMAENGKDIAREQEKTSAQKTAAENYKSQLETAQEALKGFSGVDVAELNGKIKSLSESLAAKESEYQAKLSDMEFDSFLAAAIKESGARSDKTVKPFLDLDSLKASKNREADVKAALEAVKTENDYLFTPSEPAPMFIAKGGGGAGDNLSAVRAAMGLSNE